MKYDFKNPEHFKALERQAYDGTIDISHFPPAAYRYFDQLRQIYYRYKFDGLSKSDAEDAKRSILAHYKEALSDYEYWKAAAADHQDNIRRAGELLSLIEKSTDTAEIAVCACEVISKMTGDARLYTRQIRKIRKMNTEKE